MQGSNPLARLPLALAGGLLIVFAFTFFTTPEGKLNWLLEVGPGLIGRAALAIAFPKFPMSRFVYVGVSPRHDDPQGGSGPSEAAAAKATAGEASALEASAGAVAPPSRFS